MSGSSMAYVLSPWDTAQYSTGDASRPTTLPSGPTRKEATTASAARPRVQSSTRMPVRKPQAWARWSLPPRFRFRIRGTPMEGWYFRIPSSV